ncbi:hypothetical protein K2173_027235 [Erythroxylum novogranatense]|uniref:Protein DEFECTIVE IN MERISTEM SILENCING 3 n=1 Tax=Erythroxylum novogranatense TaxID=1862640 RepID=A0AAV8U125_9ROSI|nr:hypothetical protein K2173_027235 [Erythroxylum novogranatense]
MLHSNHKPSILDSSALLQVDKMETSIVPRDEGQNGGFSQAQSIIYSSQKLQDDLQILGMKIKQHEENIKALKIQKIKLEDSILDMQVILGKYHSSAPPNTGNNNDSSNWSEETTKQILQFENSAAGILCQLTVRHGKQASHLTLVKDVFGIVATLASVEDDNLSRLLSEFLGLDTMLAIVCKTFDGVKALETYEKEGCINKGSGLHGLGASIGRALDGRFIVICLENLRPYCGEFVADDLQRRLDLIKPKLPNGECPRGFVGFAVNMIKIEHTNLFYLTRDGYGLRETLFYNLFSRLQVYKTREDLIQARPCISDGAISLDGGMIRATGVFSLGNRINMDVRFPKAFISSGLPNAYIETEEKLKKMSWDKEKLLEDINREQSLLNVTKSNFEGKKEEFLKFMAQSSPYAAQHQNQLSQSRFNPSFLKGISPERGRE